MAMTDSEVIEGFICPICKIQYVTAETLLNHFQEVHSEEQDLIKTFRDLIDKAKKKILKKDTSIEPVNSVKSPINECVFEEHQDIGFTRCHTSSFQSTRDLWIQRLTLPTNQLIIRLGKLLDDMPTDPLKKKAHEQKIVSWIDGEAVPRCPNCAGSFHLTRRQHHCRTCGSIMCNDCSHFMSLATAKRIIEKPLTEEDMTTIGDLHLRLCIHCISLLELREQIRESRTSKPIISQFYERLYDYKKEADVCSKEYRTMCNSLNSGESTYNLRHAQILRGKIVKLAETIDLLSSKISVLGKDSESPPQGQALKLQNSIRSASTAYLRTHLLTLPMLPTEEEFKRAQDKRRLEATTRIKEERIRKAMATEPTTPKNNSLLYQTHQRNSSSTSDSAVSIGQGWIPEKKNVYESDDPLIEQMNIIRNYIKEARAAKKLDEVASLEANLKELKREYWRKQDLEDYPRSGESSEAASLCSYEDCRTQSDHSGDIP